MKTGIPKAIATLWNACLNCKQDYFPLVLGSRMFKGMRSKYLTTLSGTWGEGTSKEGINAQLPTTVPDYHMCLQCRMWSSEHPEHPVWVYCYQTASKGTWKVVSFPGPALKNQTWLLKCPKQLTTIAAGSKPEPMRWSRQGLVPWAFLAPV